MTRTVDVTVTYLEMTSPDQLRASRRLPEGIRLVHVHDSHAGRLAGELYRGVGANWHWRDRLDWSDAEWTTAVVRPGVELWIATDAATESPAGYFELERTGEVVDIHYFGLLPEFIGRGLGGWMLTRAVEQAWALGPARVTLNTCTLDGEAALPNYLARGFSVVRTVQQRRDIPQ